MKKLLIILLLISSSVSAQFIKPPDQPKNFGGYTQVSFETFYVWNVSYGLGARYKNNKIGIFYQQATMTGDYRYTRKGIFAEVGFANVDHFAYLTAGVRVATTNDQFVTIVPHFTTSFRVHKYVEIPLTFSSYKNHITGAIGVRVLF